MTRTHGAVWTDVTAAIAKAGGPADRWVSRVFASRHDAGTAYVTKTGFRHRRLQAVRLQDDRLRRHVDVSSRQGLPDQPVNVIWEDRINRHLLFLGTDKGVWVSIDDGARWMRMKGSMPDVPVHDLHVHPREHDLIVATYGRAVYITDVSVLQQTTEALLAEDMHLFDIDPRVPFQSSGWGNYDFYGDRYRPTPNEPNALVINYYLRDTQEQEDHRQSGRHVRSADPDHRGDVAPGPQCRDLGFPECGAPDSSRPATTSSPSRWTAASSRRPRGSGTDGDQSA